MVLNKTWQHIVDPLPEKNISMDVFIGKTLVNSVFFCIKEHWLIHDHFQHIFIKSEDLSPDVAALSVNLSDPKRPGVGVGLTSLRGGSKRRAASSGLPQPKGLLSVKFGRWEPRYPRWFEGLWKLMLVTERDLKNSKTFRRTCGWLWKKKTLSFCVQACAGRCFVCTHRYSLLLTSFSGMFSLVSCSMYMIAFNFWLEKKANFVRITGHWLSLRVLSDLQKQHAVTIRLNCSASRGVRSENHTHVSRGPTEGVGRYGSGRPGGIQLTAYINYDSWWFAGGTSKRM